MDNEHEQNQKANKSADLSRREFVALSLAAGIAASAGIASAADLEVVETDVEVKTPDGICDAVFIHPKTGTHPGVLVWADSFGLRPAIRGIGRRMAAEGYSVLVPNTYYRTAKAPLFGPSLLLPITLTTTRPVKPSLMTRKRWQSRQRRWRP